MIYGGNSHSLEDLQDVVDETVVNMRKKKNLFDTIVVRGMSGVLVGAPVALRLKVPLVVVRKSNEKAHDSNGLINSINFGDRWLFLDDFIDKGNTLKATKAAVTRNLMFNKKRHYVGAFLYGDMHRMYGPWNLTKTTQS